MSTLSSRLNRRGFSSALSALLLVGLSAGSLRVVAQGTDPAADALSLRLAGASFKSPDLAATPMRLTAAAAGEVTVRLYDQVLRTGNRVLLQETTVAHPGGGATVEVPFDEAYLGEAIHAEAQQIGTGAADSAAFVSDLRAFGHPRTEPADFDAWWASKKAELAAAPPNWVETRLPDFDTPYSTAYRVTGDIGDGRHVTMWVAVPKAGPGSPAELTSDATFPAMIVFPAAGNANDRYFQTPFTAAERVGAISVSVNLHEDYVTGSDGTGQGGSYIHQGVSDRETNYFLAGIKRCLRAVDYVRQHPRFNGGDIMAFGESQGGGLAKTVAGLYPEHVDVVMTQHDALSTHGARPGAPEGWPRWVSTFAADFEDVAYFDATFHARRIRARKTFSNTGFADEVVAPAAALASFNQVNVHGATKVVLLSEDRAHTSPPAYALGYLNFASANLAGALSPRGPESTLYYEDRVVNVTRDNDTLSAGYVRAGAPQDLSDGRGRWVTLSGPGHVAFATPTAPTTAFTVPTGTPADYVVAFEIEEAESYSEVYVVSGTYDLSTAAVLPVELTSFTAAARACDITPGTLGPDCAVDLAWTTAAERDDAGFELERSTDTVTWTVIAEILGGGPADTPTDYAFADESPVYGDNYYRLLRRDPDGAGTLSEVVVVSFEAASSVAGTDAALADVRAYPNPVRGFLTVAGLPLSSATTTAPTVTLVDLSGRTVVASRRASNRGAGAGLVRLDLDGVAPGVYVLRVSGHDARVTRRVVVQ